MKRYYVVDVRWGPADKDTYIMLALTRFEVLNYFRDNFSGANIEIIREVVRLHNISLINQ